MFEWYVAAFTVLSALGLGFALWFEWDAFRDLQFLHEQKLNGNRGVIAYGNLRTGLIRLIVKATFTTIGLSIMLDHPWRRGVLIGGMLLIVVILLVDSIYERWDRQKLLSAYRESDS